MSLWRCHGCYPHCPTGSKVRRQVTRSCSWCWRGCDFTPCPQLDPGVPAAWGATEVRPLPALPGGLPAVNSPSCCGLPAAELVPVEPVVFSANLVKRRGSQAVWPGLFPDDSHGDWPARPWAVHRWGHTGCPLGVFPRSSLDGGQAPRVTAGGGPGSLPACFLVCGVPVLCRGCAEGQVEPCTSPSPRLIYACIRTCTHS